MNYLRVLGVLLFTIVLSTGLSAQKNKDVDDALSDKNKLQGFYVGSYVGFGYANGWQIDFSPEVGYKVKDWLMVGAGLTYSYSQSFQNYRLFDNANSSFIDTDKTITAIIGPRISVKANFYQQFYGVVNYEYLTHKVKFKGPDGNLTLDEVQDQFDVGYVEDGCTTGNCFNKHENVLYLGGGYTSSFGEGFGFYTEFIVDLLYDNRNSPRNSPLAARIGLFYAF